MSSEIDSTRQRTVAELLAEHGGVSTDTPRRRRREPEGPEPPAAPPTDAAPATGGGRHGSREADPQAPTVRNLPPPGRFGALDVRHSGGAPGAPQARRPRMDAIPEPRRGLDEPNRAVARPDAAGRAAPPSSSVPPNVPRRPAGSTARSAPPRAASPTAPGPDATTPAPRVDRPFLPNALRQPPVPGAGVEGRAAGGEAVPGGSFRPGVGAAGPGNGRRPRTAGSTVRRDRAAPGPGPSTGVWNPFADDVEDDGSPGPLPPARSGPPAGESGHRTDTDGDTHADGDDVEFAHPGFDDLDGFDDLEPRRAGSWAGVMAQWLAGAVAGAVLWMLFRYLWLGLPVVAGAAALLVTAGLVLLVRQLLHEVDRRTTALAVLVGLLITASPAVLVLLGR